LSQRDEVEGLDRMLGKKKTEMQLLQVRLCSVFKRVLNPNFLKMTIIGVLNPNFRPFSFELNKK